jgi:hypothetical protein
VFFVTFVVEKRFVFFVTFVVEQPFVLFVPFVVEQDLRGEPFVVPYGTNGLDRSTITPSPTISVGA